MTNTLPPYEYTTAVSEGYTSFVKKIDSGDQQFDEKMKNLFSYVGKQRYSIKYSRLTYRTVNNWMGVGLLDDVRTNFQIGWRQFSFFDLVWLETIKRLRSFGLSIEQIIGVKKSLFENENYQYIFQYFVLLCLQHKFVSLLVLPEGYAHLDFQTNVGFIQTHMGLNEFVHINFYELVYEISQNPNLSINVNAVTNLNPDELEILQKIRSNKYKTLEIYLKNGTIKRVDLTEDINVDKKIVSLLKQNEYQDITIKQENGKIISISRKLKKKL